MERKQLIIFMPLSNNTIIPAIKPDIKIFTTGGQGLEQALKDAYKVLKPCFEEIGSPLEGMNTFRSLAEITGVNPQARLHVVVAHRSGKPVGAALAITYGGKINAAFWVYEGVLRTDRANGLAGDMHKAMNESIHTHLGNNLPYHYYIEFACIDPNAINKKLINKAVAEVNMPYMDALNKSGWGLTVKTITGISDGELVSVRPESLPKDTLYAVLRANRELAVMHKITEAEENIDPVLQFYKKHMKTNDIPTENVLGYWGALERKTIGFCSR